MGRRSGKHIRKGRKKVERGAPDGRKGGSRERGVTLLSK